MTDQRVDKNIIILLDIRMSQGIETRLYTHACT